MAFGSAGPRPGRGHVHNAASGASPTHPGLGGVDGAQLIRSLCSSAEASGAMMRVVQPSGLAGPGAAASMMVPTEPPSSSSELTPELLVLLLPLLLLAFAVLFVVVSMIFFVVVLRQGGAISLGQDSRPVDISHEEMLENNGAFDGVLQRWLDQADPETRAGYERTAAWCAQNPPASPRDTDITMAQFLGIQEKGVSAWCFDPAYEANPSVMVSARTEMLFLPDGPDMAPSEGGSCSVQSNLPLPKVNDVYYWEAKIFSKPENTEVAIGLATKPYPSFRAPGLCKHSVGYFSQDGFKCHNYPFAAQSYGPPFLQGDVIGVGFRPRTGTVFFTRNGRRLDDAFTGLQNRNLFPTVAANGSAEIHVNFGQAGFVLIEANVRRWGLAPMVGTLAPPPAYGQDKGSILIEAGYEPRTGTDTPPPPPSGPSHRAASSRDTPPYTALTIEPPSRSRSPPPPPPPSGIRMDTLHSTPGSASRRVRGAHRPASASPPPYPAEERPAEPQHTGDGPGEVSADLGDNSQENMERHEAQNDGELRDVRVQP